MKKKTIESVDVSNKRVICRVDYNVPLSDDLEITDDLRIKSSFDTVNYLLERNATVILMSHLGRPKGKVVEELRLKPVYNYLKSKFSTAVHYVDDCIGPKVEKTIAEAKPGEIVLLENLRFYAEEEKNDPEFAKKLASLAEIYVNDAFGTAHRAHASTEGITKYIDLAVAGFLMIKEIDYLVNALEHPERPLTAIVGGKKVSDKISVLKRFIESLQCNNILIGGGMAYTFFKAQGYEIGDSILDEPGIQVAKDIMELAKKNNTNLVLPTDVVIADKFSNDANKKQVTIKEGIPQGWQGLDIGRTSIKSFQEIIEDSRMIIWNGPVGVFEFPHFAIGTKEIVKVIAENSRGIVSIIGGGDTAAAVEKFGFASDMSHISTGGGAALELLEGKELPGLVALNDA